MNIRQCDVCRVTQSQSAVWYFVIDGKAEPSAWRLAEHWCPVCMEAAREFLTELRS